MQPENLIHPSAAGLPAPFWFIEFFKVLGFALHAVPMNLWFAGLPIALWLHWRGGPEGRRWAGRFLRQMPVIIAVGVNLGIVPLLFIQLAYYQVFYPATILMAWSWLAIVAALIPAYYGVYAYAWGLRDASRAMPSWRVVAGWSAASLFILIGFLFANGLSLMEHVDRWPELWKNSSVAGAALGTAVNHADPTLWARWLMMFGLALGTTAAWIVLDAAWLGARPPSAVQKNLPPSAVSNQVTGLGAAELWDCRRWAFGFAWKLYTVGMIWASAAGLWYVLFTWSAALQSRMFNQPWLPLMLLTAVAPGLPWLLLWRERNEFRSTMAPVIALAQFGVLAVNAVSRQAVQNINLGKYLDVSSQPLDVQWSPLILFLVVFVLGLAVVGWMLAQIVKLGRGTVR